MPPPSFFSNLHLNLSQSIRLLLPSPDLCINTSAYHLHIPHLKQFPIIIHHQTNLHLQPEMASTASLLLSSSSSSSSSSSVFNPFSSSSSKAGRANIRHQPRCRIVASSRKEAHDHHQNYSSRLVDENMIVLRKKIHEMKMVERNYEPPAEWMDWEKRYYTSYDSIICQAMGLLQSQLMNTRPSLALGFMALIVFSVPASTFMVISHLLEITKGALTGGFGV